MRKNINQETIEGRIYDYSLAIKKASDPKSKNFGVEYISGSINVATDEEGLNVIPVHYTFVKEYTNSGNINNTFVNLKKILRENKTWLTEGKDNATKVRMNTSIALNDYYPNGGDQLVSQQRNEGGFISFIAELNPDLRVRKKFIFDIIINSVTLIEANPEQNISEDFVRIKAAVFDFKNALLPITLVAKDSYAPGSVNYFLGLEASEKNPVYTKVMGEIVNTTIKINKVMENAFGEAVVDSTSRHEREWIVTWAQPQPYVFDSSDTITKKELEEVIANRNTYLAELKNRTKNYYEQRQTAGTSAIAAGVPTPSVIIPEEGFSF